MSFAVPKIQELYVSDIDVLPGRRAVEESAVASLAASIERLGMMSPISARYMSDRPSEDGESEDSYVLITGAHRLEAVKRLGREKITCAVFDDTLSDDDARMWEISENLHRSDLTKEQRDAQIVEWAALAAKKVREIPAPTADKLRGGNQSTAKGYRQTASDLGIDEKEVRDAHKLAELKPEIKKAAKDAGLSRSDTLKVARSDPEEQSSRVVEMAAFKGKPGFGPISDADVIDAEFQAMMRAWNKAGPQARQMFLEAVDTPVIDRGSV